MGLSARDVTQMLCAISDQSNCFSRNLQVVASIDVAQRLASDRIGRRKAVAVKANTTWWRRIYPATKTDVELCYEAVRSELNQIAHNLDQKLDQTANNLDHVKYLVIVNNAINTTFLSPDLQTQIRVLLRLLRPVRIDEFAKIRVGSEFDGGYIQLDDYKRLSLALSLGIANNDDWDVATARRGIPVKQFDHTIERAPSNHSLLEFKCRKISGIKSSDAVTLPELVAQHADRHQPNIILKIDIEGEEWNVFDHVDSITLARFAQIICEFHYLHKLHDPQFYDTALRVFQKLRDLFVVFHVHANNFGSIVNIGNVALPQTLEISFANRSCYSFKDNDESFPTAIDKPNNSSVADIYLGPFRF